MPLRNLFLFFGLSMQITNAKSNTLIDNENITKKIDNENNTTTTEHILQSQIIQFNIESASPQCANGQ